MSAIERIKYVQKMKRDVEPFLFEEGWTKDERGPRRPNPFNDDDYPILVPYRDPKSGLYFSFFDAMRVLLGRNPRYEGLERES